MSGFEEKCIPDPITPIPDTPQPNNQVEDPSEIPGTGEIPRYVFIATKSNNKSIYFQFTIQ